MGNDTFNERFHEPNKNMKYLLIAILFSGCINATSSNDAPAQKHNLAGAWEQNGDQHPIIYFQKDTFVRGMLYNGGSDSVFEDGVIHGDSVIFDEYVYQGGSIGGIYAIRAQIIGDSILRGVWYVGAYPNTFYSQRRK